MRRTQLGWAAMSIVAVTPLLLAQQNQNTYIGANATGQAAKPDQFAKVRKNIARVKTVLAQSSDARRKV